MDTDSKVRDVFDLARDLGQEERRETLDKYCAGDAALRGQVEVLLRLYDSEGAVSDPLKQLFDIADQTLEGRTVSHYKVGKRLGAGGMGVVYEAIDERLRRRVALKFLPAGFGREKKARQRFEIEARTAAAADHPNICTVYEIGATETGRLFIAMALCEGENLRNILAEGSLSVPDTLDIGIQVAEALARVHEKDILHRDIKPSNIIVQEDGLVKIVDFGIAKLRGSDVTATSDTVGTIGYMSPEQLTGRGTTNLSDIWSLGVVLYEMLAGVRPFDAPYAQAVSYQVLNEDPEPLDTVNPVVGPRVASVVHRCLQKNASDRFESAGDLLIALHRAREEELPLHVVSPSGAPARRSGKRLGQNGDGAVMKVFICYKSSVDHDERLADRLKDALRESCDVFADRQTGIGRRWVQRMESQLAQSDAVVALVSGESARSELVVGQIELARRLSDEHGHPVLLPIRLSNERFGYPLAAYLKDVPSASWDENGDFEHLVREILDAIASGSFERTSEPVESDTKADTGSIPRPHPSAQPSFLEMPEGTMDPHSRFYIERPEDSVALAAIERPGVTITIKGPRQMGKSSLLMRTMAGAASAGKSVVFLDFQLFGHHALSGGETFFRQFCSWISDELDLDDKVDEYWSRPLGDSQLCTRYVGKHVLKSIDTPLVLAMDEVERVFDTEFRSDFFSMLRSWHNDRAIKAVWRNLDMALVTSTEPYQLIENLNQSPFNVGEVIELSDFNSEQVAELNARHGTPLDDEGLSQLCGLVGGHPYLVRKALFIVASGRMTAPEVIDAAAHERGPFGDHLRNHLFRIHENEDLVSGMREVLRSGKCGDESVFWRLRGAGLIRRENGRVVARCKMYEHFFEEHLHA